MTPTPPHLHRYRCETCDNENCDLSNTSLEKAEKTNTDVGRIRTMMVLRRATEIHGCCSHSQNNPLAKENLTVGMVNAYEAGREEAEQRITEDLLERIKEMGDDENCGPLWEMNSDECYSFNGNCTLCKVTKAIALLREGK